MKLTKFLFINIVSTGLLILLSLLSYSIYGINIFGYDTPKYLYQIRILKNYGLMLLIPESVKEELTIKFNYIYLYTFLAYFLSQVLSINYVNAITAFSVIILVPLYGFTLFIIVFMLLETLYSSVSNFRTRLIFVLLALVSSILAMYSISTAYLVTHLFRQFFNIILFNILLILVISELRTSQQPRKYGKLYLFVLILVMVFNQIESAIFTLMYMTLLAVIFRITKSRYLMELSEQYIMSIVAFIVSSVLIIVLSMLLGIEQVVGIVSSSIKGFMYYSSRQESLINLILTSEHRLGTDILGGKYGLFINMFILIATSILFILDIQVKRTRITNKVILPLGTLVFLVTIISFTPGLPWVFQTRTLMFYRGLYYIYVLVIIYFFHADIK